MKKALRDPAEIFEAARSLADGPERRIFLDGACAGDAALRARIEALLRAAEQADDFFAATRTAVDEGIAAIHQSRGTVGLAEALNANLPADEPIGTRIGRYMLLRKIGEGGCGVVYEAEQEQPVRRRVALKIIKLGMETKAVIARFEAERQALAMMDHPNIAHVFDAGATHRGPPYFVMELVRGVKITEYCDRNRLDTRQRLDLFIQICHAIQHAHQKGIVHGDIKPSNIMVTLHDGTPVPKVIDFGISKATEVRLVDTVMITGDGQLVGTPAYMSPEQAEMGGMDIDTRSDIYSLGVLLYEMLAGKTPFDPKELGSAGLDGMRRILRERDPPPPSARLKLLDADDAQQVAHARRSDLPRLMAVYRGDLDWIVMKALEKDRRRRYETANGLAVDIQRHLSNEPVMARPPSRLYRFQKLVRRNRGVFAAAGAVAVALIIGMGTSTWLFLREREARRRAVDAEQQETRLRHDAELRQKLTQAALLVSQDRFQEADALLGSVSVSQPTVEGAAVFRSLGEWHAINLRWRQAAERFDVLLRTDQLDGWDVSTLDYLRQGPALVESGDLAGYDKFREDVIARYGSMPVAAGDRIVKICLLVPANDRVMVALRVYANGTAASLSAAEANGDPFTAAWRAVSLALWEYRCGDYAKAANWGERCLGYAGSANPPRNAAAQVVLAMADQQLGRAAEARKQFEQAREIINAACKDHLSRGSPVQGFWFDWALARVLLREAAALIEPASH
ncbi:MAG TPA: serine/threonine-protein kinase [Opitutaceae bacterium]|nr:serine/threonine-protein kinase [Opitutaceae bacterium]